MTRLCRPLPFSLAVLGFCPMLALSCATPSTGEQEASATGFDAADEPVDAAQAAPDANGDEQDAAPRTKDAGADLDAGSADASLDELLFFPPELRNIPLDQTGRVLAVTASTLTEDADGPVLYAAVINPIETALCGAGIALEFYDTAGQLVGTASGGVLTERLFQFPDGSVVLPCVAPGERGIAVARGLPDLPLAELGYIGHRFPAFAIDGAEPVDRVRASDVQLFETDDGSLVFRGLVTNDADSAVVNLGVSVVSLNSVGRPLALATATTEAELAAGASWPFETTAVARGGVDQMAFAGATVKP